MDDAVAAIKARRDWREGRDLSPFEVRLDDECLAKHYAEDVTFLLAEVERLNEVIEEHHRDFLAIDPWLDGVGLIAAERKRQIESEGWTPEHDDEHTDGSLLAAAECYVSLGLMFVRPDHPHAAPPMYDMPIGPTGWPWLDGYKADLSGPIPSLVKAGALIAAEIDRLQRVEGSVAE